MNAAGESAGALFPRGVRLSYSIDCVSSLMFALLPERGEEEKERLTVDRLKTAQTGANCELFVYFRVFV